MPRTYASIKTTDAAWDGSPSRFTDEEYKRSCLIDRGGDAAVKTRCSLPVREPDGTLNVKALATAAGRISSLKNVTDAQKASAARKLRALYRAIGETAPDALKEYGESVELETVDLEGVDIMAADVRIFGSGACPPEGEVYSVEQLQKIAADTNAVLEELRPANKWKDLAPNKIGHGPKQLLAYSAGMTEGEAPALGWLENLRVSEDGKLLTDVKNVPKKFASLIKAGAFRLRSPEINAYRSQETEEEYPAVVRGLAWLGATPPAFKTLDDVISLYQGGSPALPTGALMYADEGLADDEVKALNYAAGDVVWKPEDSAQAVMNELREVLNPGPGPCRFWVMDVASDRKRALVSGDGPETWVVPIEYVDGELKVAPSNEWTMAESAWVEASDNGSGSSTQAMPSSSSDYREGNRGPASETSAMPEGTDTQTGTEGQEPEGLSDATKSLFAKLFGTKDAPKDEGELIKLFAAAAGVPDETDPEKIREAVEGARSAAQTPVEEQIPEGMKLMSETDLKELKEGAALAVDLNAKLFAERRDNFLREQMRLGKFAPADKDDWEKRYDENEDWTKGVLEKLPVNDELAKTYGVDDEGGESITEGLDVAQLNRLYSEWGLGDLAIQPSREEARS